MQIKVEELQDLNNDLMAINDSLGLDDAGLVEQLEAIKNKNKLLQWSQVEKELALELIEKKNQQLILKDEALKNQISQYQEITNDLLAINDSLGLEDASLLEQLQAIKIKNNKGPSRLPCGTPDVTLVHFDATPSITTRWRLPYK